MATTVVKTGRELRMVLRRRDAEIVIADEGLAKRVKRIKALPIPVVVGSIAILGAGIGGVTLFGPVGLLTGILAGVVAVTLTGGEIALIVAIVGLLGVTLAIALVKDYDAIVMEIPEVMRVVLTRKSEKRVERSAP